MNKALTEWLAEARAPVVCGYFLVAVVIAASAVIFGFQDPPVIYGTVVFTILIVASGAIWLTSKAAGLEKRMHAMLDADRIRRDYDGDVDAYFSRQVRGGGSHLPFNRLRRLRDWSVVLIILPVLAVAIGQRQDRHVAGAQLPDIAASTELVAKAIRDFKPKELPPLDEIAGMVDVAERIPVTLIRDWDNVDASIVLVRFGDALLADGEAGPALSAYTSAMKLRAGSSEIEALPQRRLQGVIVAALRSIEAWCQLRVRGSAPVAFASVAAQIGKLNDEAWSTRATAMQVRLSDGSAWSCRH